MGQLTIAMVTNLAFLFIVKVFDNMLGTSKNILIQQSKAILAAINVAVSQLIFYKLISAVGSSGSNLELYTVAIASGFGTYIAIKINDKKSKDKTYVNVIMCDHRDSMIKLREYMMINNITNSATDGYTKDWRKTIVITAFAKTKYESRLLDKYLEESDTKFKRVVTSN